MIAITLDIDWAADFVIEDCLNLMNEYQAKATLFCTHQSDLLNGLDKKQYELGIHPNFNANFAGEGKHYKIILDELLELYPHAKGVRFHSLGYNAHVLDYCYQNGICYDASIYVPYQNQPFQDFNGIYRLTFQFADLHQVMLSQLSDFCYQNHPLLQPRQLTSFVFHPIHIYLNTYSLEHYQKAKAYAGKKAELEQYVNRDKFGVRDYLLSVLNQGKGNFYQLMECMP